MGTIIGLSVASWDNVRFANNFRGFAYKIFAHLNEF